MLHSLRSRQFFRFFPQMYAKEIFCASLCRLSLAVVAEKLFPHRYPIQQGQCSAHCPCHIIDFYKLSIKTNYFLFFSTPSPCGDFPYLANARRGRIPCAPRSVGCRGRIRPSQVCVIPALHRGGLPLLQRYLYGCISCFYHVDGIGRHLYAYSVAGSILGV